MLRIRKLADRSVAREVRFDPETGERLLINPATGQEEPYPFVGVQIEGDPPETVLVSQGFVLGAREEGWVSIEGEETVMRTAGPPASPISPQSPPHVFLHAEAIVFHTVDGDVRYSVVRNPDKWPDEKVEGDLEPGFGGEVLWTYELELVGVE